MVCEKEEELNFLFSADLSAVGIPISLDTTGAAWQGDQVKSSTRAGRETKERKEKRTIPIGIRTSTGRCCRRDNTNSCGDSLVGWLLD